MSKPDCFGLFGFSSAEAARKAFASLTFVTRSLGYLQISESDGSINMVQGEGKPAAAMGGGYTVTINSDVNYVNLARVTALNVTTNQTQPLDFLRLWNNALGTDMTSSQLTTMILLHEFRHTVPGGDAKQEYDPIAFNTPIVKDCIK